MPLNQMDGYRLEKEEVDRRSFAGMALAHADASAQLRSLLDLAHKAMQTSEVRQRKNIQGEIAVGQG